MKKLLIVILLFIVTQVAISQGINTGFNFVGISRTAVSTGVTYSAEATQYFNRMTVKPSADTLLIMAEFIDSLKLCGVWDKLDVLVILANSDTTNALLNLKGSSFTGIRIGSPTFTPYKGITGATNKYINAQFNPVTDSLTNNYKRNSASFGVCSNTNNSGLTYDMGTQDANGWIAMLTNYNSNFYFTNNTVNSHQTVSNTNTVGFFVSSRTAGNVTKAYKNGDSLATSTQASTPKPNYMMFVCAANISGTATYHTTRQYALYFIGGGLTTQNVKDFNSAVTKLKTKIGF